VTKIELFTIWERNRRGIDEKCLMTENGDYIGQETGSFYSKEDHYHSTQVKGKIVKVDQDNHTGMIHLDDDSDFEEDYKCRKSEYIGCFATFEEAHYFGNIKVYRCLELGEYFSENELEIFN
jgi:hypothetical protein